MSDNFNEIDWVPFRKTVVDAVDTIVLCAKKNGSTLYVRNDKDWDTMTMIVRVWRTLFPEHYSIFRKSQEEIRSELLNEHAAAREVGGAEIQHVMEIPQMLYQMIKIVFPMQKWDKKFIHDMSVRLPLFKIPKSAL